MKSRGRRKAKRESQVAHVYIYIIIAVLGRNVSHGLAYCTKEKNNIDSIQQELNTTLSVVNTSQTTVGCLIEERHGDVDAGQGTLFLGIDFLV